MRKVIELFVETSYTISLRMSLEPYQFCESCVPSYCPIWCRSQKIPSGSIYLNCERLKHNGLQDECKRTKCEKNSRCYTVQMVQTTTDDTDLHCERTEPIKNNGLQQECIRPKRKLKKFMNNQTILLDQL